MTSMERFDPVVRVIDIELPRPGLGDNRGHELRLRAALADMLGEVPSLRLPLCRELAAVLPASDYRVKVVVVEGPTGWDVARVLPSAKACKPYGLGVDLGSTTVVLYLVDLDEGKVVQRVSRPNPQSVHGEDILDRIIFAGRGDGLDILQEEILGALNDATGELAGSWKISADDVVYAAIAGNTTMCHFLLALDPSHICREPYIPAVNRFDLMRPAEIGLNINPNGWVYCFPNVGSYFGGDLLAGILASGMHLKDELAMLVDVGTNAEVVLGNNEWLVACAGAAGPALEGGILSCGMRARPGAIERVEIDPKTLGVTISTIGNEKPKGLCGSGIIDLLAAMFLAGLVDQTGKLATKRAPDRMRKIKGEWAYVVAGADDTGHGEPVYISQSDIKNLIRSKGAMYTVLNVVTQSVGVDFDDILTYYVAGAFGNYIDPGKAVTIGMLPDVPLERFRGLGNAAGDGAVEALRWRKARAEVEEICDRITYLEMNVRGDFMNQLTGALFLPHTDRSLFPSVPVPGG